MEEFFKRHKNLVIALIIFILVLFVALYTNRVVNSNENRAVYGSRLDAIKDTKISESRESQITESLSGISEKTTIREQGRIIEIRVALKSDVSRDKAKEEAKKAYEKLSEDERKLYDVQVFYTKKNDKQFPIIGYVHHNKGSFSWTKDR